MNRNPIKPLLLAGLLCLAATAFAQKTEKDLDAQYATALLKPGTPAPNFTLRTLDGKTLSLAQYRGRYVVLDFWASWCGDCRRDIPNIQRLYKEYGARGVAFVGVSFDTDTAAWRKAVGKYNIEYPQVSELKKMRETAIAKAYGLNWIPSMYLIDPDGFVVLSTVMSSKLAESLKALKPSR